MTEHATAPTTDELLSRLVARLEALEPADRAATITHLLSDVDRPAPSHRHADTGREAEAASAPLVICSWASDSGLEGTTQHLTVDVQPGPTPIPKTRAATGRSLLSNGHLGVDLIHVPAGEGFAPHTHAGDHLLFVLGGYGTITAEGTIVHTAPGQAYMIEGSVPHAVGAITDHVLLSVGAPHRALDSVDRQTLTAYSSLLTPIGSIECSICGVAAGSGEELAALGCPHSPHRFT